MKVFIFCMYTSIKKSANSSSLWLSVSIAIVCYHTEVPLSLGDEAYNKKDNSKYTGMSLVPIFISVINDSGKYRSCIEIMF